MLLIPPAATPASMACWRALTYARIASRRSGWMVSIAVLAEGL
jgi:hypothetical protein